MMSVFFQPIFYKYWLKFNKRSGADTNESTFVNYNRYTFNPLPAKLDYTRF